MNSLLLSPLPALILSLLASRNGVAADLPAGKAAFTAFTACTSCHQIGPDARNAFGPQLNGLFGRPAGSVAGYGYSAAMKNSKIVWNEQTLAAFIRNPDRTVPVTKMRFFSLGFGDQKIADLLAYLRTFPAAEPARSRASEAVIPNSALKTR